MAAWYSSRSCSCRARRRAPPAPGGGRRRSSRPAERTSRCRFSICAEALAAPGSAPARAPPPRAPGRTRSRSTRRRRGDPAPPRRGPPTRAFTRSSTDDGTWMSSITFVVTQVPSGCCAMNCPSRRPRMISKAKKGLPSDFSAIWRPSSSARRSERKASFSSLAEVLRAQPRQRPLLRVLQPRESGRPLLGHARPHRPDQQDPVLRHRQRQRREQRPAVLRREVEVVDQDDRGPLGRQRPRRVDEDRLERVLRERLRALRRRLALAGARRRPGSGSASAVRYSSSVSSSPSAPNCSRYAVENAPAAVAAPPGG